MPPERAAWQAYSLASYLSTFRSPKTLCAEKPLSSMNDFIMPSCRIHARRCPISCRIACRSKDLVGLPASPSARRGRLCQPSNHLRCRRRRTALGLGSDGPAAHDDDPAVLRDPAVCAEDLSSGMDTPQLKSARSRFRTLLSNASEKTITSNPCSFEGSTAPRSAWSSAKRPDRRI